MRHSDKRKKLDIVCGGETGLFDVTLFGPGGGSRCIQFGEHLITPIEFEALAGKKTRNWKFNIKFDGKPIKALFDNKTLKSCDKDCCCTNCDIGRKFPTDLELLIEKVYLRKTYDLSIVKKEKEDTKSPKKMLNKEQDEVSPGDVKDEFFSSPEATPKKTSSEGGMSNDLTAPIHIETSQSASKHQKDIRTFFSNKSPKSKASPLSPSAKSDSSVELIAEGRPKRRVVEVDLTDNKDKRIKDSDEKPKRKPGRPPKVVAVTNNDIDDAEDLLKILHEEKKKALSPRKKLPRNVKTSETESKDTTKLNGDVKPSEKRKMSPDNSEPIVKRTKLTNKPDEDSVMIKDKLSKPSPTPSDSDKSPRQMVNGHHHSAPTTPVKTESPDKLSPSKLPTYTTMIKAALEEMNCVGGEGCTKLEILLYILRKFKPKGNVEQITTKLIQVLENGTKRGDFLSSVSLPRVLKKDKTEVKKEKDIKKEPKEVKEEVKDIKKKKKKLEKLKSKEVVKVSRGPGRPPGSPNKVKRKDKEVKNVAVTGTQQPRKLLEPLSTICKAKKLTRQEVIRKMWAYIKLKKLQDPSDKTTVICDDNLKKLTKVKKFQQSALMSYLKPFMIPLKSK